MLYSTIANSKIANLLFCYSDFKSASYTCDIFEFRKNVIKLNALKYQTGIGYGYGFRLDVLKLSQSWQKLSEKQNANAGTKKQKQKNKMESCPKFNEFERFCPDELVLISQIIPYMFIVAKTKGAQHWSERAMCFSANKIWRKFRPF